MRDSAADALARAALRAVGPGASIEERLDALERAERGERPRTHRGTSSTIPCACRTCSYAGLPSQQPSAASCCPSGCHAPQRRLCVDAKGSPRLVRMPSVVSCSAGQACGTGQPRLLQRALAAAAAAGRPHSRGCSTELALQAAGADQGGAAAAGGRGASARALRKARHQA
jgi:hypothetical protein